MSGTHKSLGLPQAAEGGAVKKLVSVLPLVVLALLLTIGTSQLMAAEGHSDWIAAKYVATGTETLSAVDFVTPGQDMRYTIRVYSDLEGGRPDGLLARQEGGTRDPGFYSIRFDSPVDLFQGQTFVVVVMLKGKAKDGRYFSSAPGIEADSTCGTETPLKVFDSEDGLTYAPAGTESPFTVRVESGVSPEATSITSFTASPGVVAGTAMTFSFSATGTTAGDNLQWVLKFGDGSPDATGAGTSPLSQTQTHTYDLAGTYTATLYMLDAVDNTQDSKTLTIVAAIPVDASADQSCGPVALNVCFTGSASHGTEPYTWLWVFGDGQKSSEQSPCHAYTKKGTYVAILTVKDSKGATGTGPAIDIDVSLPITVIATADTLDGIDPTVVNFCATAAEGIPPYTYEWDSGDTTTCPPTMAFATDPCPQHAFNGVGSYYVSVTVTDSCANDATATAPSACFTVTVHQSPWIRIVSPVSGSTQEAIVNIQTSIMVEEGVTITRVEFYVGSVLIGYTTTPPWAWMFDASGVHGSYDLTAKVYDSKGRSTTSDPVTINFDNPTLDGRVDANWKPFRLKIFGDYFDRGCQVRINGVPVPQTVRKGTTLVVAKGGNALQALIPKGVPVTVTVHNPDGGVSNESTFVW